MTLLTFLRETWRALRTNLRLRWKDWRRERTLVEKLNDRGWRP